MASPNDPLRDNRRVERDDIGRGGGAGWIWIWIWIIIIIILVVWFGGWGWGGYGGWWWGNRNVRVVQPLNGNGNNAGAINNGAGAEPLPTGNGVAVLNATDKTPFVGKPFSVSNVPVQNKVNDHVLWVGSNNSTPMLVVLTGPGNNAANANISNGNRVDITGTVEKAPPKDQAQHNWQLGDDDANRLEQEGAYIQATQVTQTQPVGGQQQ